jgi:hypothetical protein
VSFGGSNGAILLVVQTYVYLCIAAKLLARREGEIRGRRGPRCGFVWGEQVRGVMSSDVDERKRSRYC